MEESTEYRGCHYPIRKALHWCPAMLLAASFLGCGGVVGSGPSQPLPTVVTVGVAPVSASVLLGNPQTFTATVSNATNTAVTWSVNGIAGGNPAAGTIDANGVYTAPATLPASGSVTVQATSVTDSTKSATSSVHVTSDISVSISPQGIAVELGASQAFAGVVTSAGKPNPGFTWIVSGTGCAGTTCGAVDFNGNYTAPQILPAPPNVTLGR